MSKQINGSLIITAERDVAPAVDDLLYFRNEMLRLHDTGELSDTELIDLMGFVNTIIAHIANGNRNEGRLVNIMGGTVIETESERLVHQGLSQGLSQGMVQGQAKMLIEPLAHGKYWIHSCVGTGNMPRVSG